MKQWYGYVDGTIVTEGKIGVGQNGGCSFGAKAKVEIMFMAMQLSMLRWECK